MWSANMPFQTNRELKSNDPVFPLTTRKQSQTSPLRLLPLLPQPVEWGVDYFAGDVDGLGKVRDGTFLVNQTPPGTKVPSLILGDVVPS